MAIWQAFSPDGAELYNGEDEEKAHAAASDAAAKTTGAAVVRCDGVRALTIWDQQWVGIVEARVDRSAPLDRPTLTEELRWFAQQARRSGLGAIAVILDLGAEALHRGATPGRIRSLLGAYATEPGSAADDLKRKVLAIVPEKIDAREATLFVSVPSGDVHGGWPAKPSEVVAQLGKGRLDGKIDALFRVLASRGLRPGKQAEEYIRGKTDESVVDFWLAHAATCESVGTLFKGG